VRAPVPTNIDDRGRSAEEVTIRVPMEDFTLVGLNAYAKMYV
jgi:hypothetical protein